MSNSFPRELEAGLVVDQVVEWTSSEELGELLAESSMVGRTVVPFGGRGSLQTGRPVTADVGLDLTRCRGILSYSPADLTLSVRAGTTWSEIQATLGDHGQTLPLDVPFPDRTTVGGVVATGFSGARRYRQGSLRDLLIGCEYVRGDGLVANAGGMVVKNVSGFEIPRFLHGSWGALAVLTSVNLKVLPRPRADGTAIFPVDHLAEAITRGIDLIRGGAPLDAITVVRQGNDICLAVRATGRSRAVKELLNDVSSEVGKSPEKRLYSDDSMAWWQASTEAFAAAPDGILVAIGARIDQLALLATELEQVTPLASLLVMPGLGSIRIRVQLADIDDPARTLETIRARASARDASSIVEAAPVDLRSTCNIWGSPDSGMSTMQAIKRAFDPSSILNRGRLFV
jgi:glycolate oxidase FAD binding subunit